MKRLNNIYSKVYHMDNLLLACKKAKKNKYKLKELQLFENNKKQLLQELQYNLQNKTFKTSKYKMYNIIDKGKNREIYDLPFYPDRIVHWALMLQIENMFLNHFIFDTYAAIPRKGGHLAIKRIQKVLSYEHKEDIYCLKLDIQKFFPSIDQKILINLLTKKIKDPDLMWLLSEIIHSIPKGIPIGNYCSQYFGNFYLSFFDHWCKEELNLKNYYRYMDDIIILNKDKHELHRIKNKIEVYLKTQLNLNIKKNWQVFPVHKTGIDFIGYRLFGEYTLLRKRTAKNMKSKLRRLLNTSSPLSSSDISCVQSYHGWILPCNSYNLYKTYIKPLQYKIKKEKLNEKIKIKNNV